MPPFTICNISIRCPQNVSVKFQKIPCNTPQIMSNIILEMPILSGSRNTMFLCMSL